MGYSKDWSTEEIDKMLQLLTDILGELKKLNNVDTHVSKQV